MVGRGDDHTILGLRPGASRDELRRAYRDLVKVWHPDRFTDEPRLQRKAQEQLKTINIAYHRLLAASTLPTAPAVTLPPAADRRRRRGARWAGLIALAALGLHVAGLSLPAAVLVPISWPSADTVHVGIDLVRGSSPDGRGPASHRQPPPAGSLANGTEIEPSTLLPGRGRLTVLNATERDAVVEVAEERGGRRLVYVRAHQEAAIDRIPAGRYRVSLGYGVDWDPKERGFQRERSRVEVERTLLFDERYRHDRLEAHQDAITLRVTVARTSSPW